MTSNKKNLLWIITGLIIAVAFFTWLFFYLNPPVQIGFANLYNSPLAPNHPEAKNYLIKNQTDFDKLLDFIYPDGVPDNLSHLYHASPIPILSTGINFSDNMILALFMGEQPSGGYDLDVSKVVSRWGMTKIYVDLISPGVSCITTQSVTSPWRLMSLGYTDDKIEFVTTPVVRDCAN